MKLYDCASEEEMLELEERHMRRVFQENLEREAARERRMREYEEIIRGIEEEMKSHNGRLRNLRNT